MDMRTPSSDEMPKVLAKMFRKHGMPTTFYVDNENDDDLIFEALEDMEMHLWGEGLDIPLITLKEYLYEEIIRPYQRKQSLMR